MQPGNGSKVLDSSETPQLTYAEAEAALLALGPRLKWDADGYSNGLNEHGDFYYTEWRETKDAFVSRHIGLISKGNRNARLYKTLAEARLACERHYATGKWD